MKFGLVLSTYVYNDERARLAAGFFASLSKTVTPSCTPLLVIVERPAVVPFHVPPESFAPFWTDVRGNNHQGVEFSMSEQPAVYGTDIAFARGAEYVVHLNDDALVHPRWLVELEALIGRHPGARAWSIYRSAYEATHRTLEVADGDVRVQSLCGLGLTLSKGEWAQMGVDWRHSHWPSPSGSTLDLWHVHARPGPRWCTAKSWMEHTGKSGIHCTPDIPEHAVDFQGSGP